MRYLLTPIQVKILEKETDFVAEWSITGAKRKSFDRTLLVACNLLKDPLVFHEGFCVFLESAGVVGQGYNLPESTLLLLCQGVAPEERPLLGTDEVALELLMAKTRAYYAAHNWGLALGPRQRRRSLLPGVVKPLISSLPVSVRRSCLHWP